MELVVRVAPDNDLILDLDSVTVDGQRYALRTDPNRIESRRDDSLIARWSWESGAITITTATTGTKAG